MNVRAPRRTSRRCKIGAGEADIPRKTHFHVRSHFAFGRTYKTQSLPWVLRSSSIPQWLSRFPRSIALVSKRFFEKPS